MKLKLRVGAALLSILLLVAWLPACAAKKDPFAITDFYSLTIEKGEILKAVVALNLADVEAHEGEKAYIYELLPGEDLLSLSGKEPVGEAKIGSEMIFEFPLREEERTRLYSTFAVCYENGSLLINRAKSIDNPERLATSAVAFSGGSSPKGLCLTDVEQAASLGIAHAMIDVPTHSIFADTGVAHRVGGEEYTFSASAIERLDARVSAAYCAGMQVSLRIDCNAFNSFVAERHALPLLDFLANRYCTDAHGVVTAFFIEEENARDAAEIAAYANAALLSNVKNGRVYVVCDAVATEQAETFFEIVGARIADCGDFAWGAAISMPRMGLSPWEASEAEKLDLHTLPTVLDRIEDLEDAPSYYAVCDLSFDASDENLQAVSLAYAYAKAVEAGAGLVYYGAQQGSNGLFGSDGDLRVSAEMFRRIDLGLETEQIYLCKSISSEAWETVSALKPSRTVLGGNGVSGNGVGEKETLFDFSSRQLFDFVPIGGIGEAEFYDAAAWKKPVLKLWLDAGEVTGLRKQMQSGQALAGASALTVRLYAQYKMEQSCSLTLRLVGSDMGGEVVTYESVGALQSRSWESVTFDISEFTSCADLSQPCSVTVICEPSVPTDEAFVLFVKDISVYSPQEGGGYLLPVILTLVGILLGFALIFVLYRVRIFRRKRRR